MEELEIRLATEKDRDKLIKWLNEPTIMHFFPMCDSKEVMESIEIWMNYIRIGAVLTATWNKIPCGTANLYITPYKKIAHQALFAIIVDKEYRNRGIGTLLLKELMKMAKEKFHIELFHLEVYEDNPAYNLYKRLGFTEYGYQKKFAKENGKYRAKHLMQINL